VKRVFFTTNAQKVLGFLALDPGRGYLSREIQKATKLSKAGVNLAVGELARLGLVRREKRGRDLIHSINHRNPVINQVKVLQAVIAVSPLVQKLKRFCRRIVLYGSASRGEDGSASDVDLFVVSDLPPEEVKKITGKKLAGRKIQLISVNPVGYVELESRDPVFFREVERGILLWEEQ
jgi:predicted nucleotidyltransferase